MSALLLPIVSGGGEWGRRAGAARECSQKPQLIIRNFCFQGEQLASVTKNLLNGVAETDGIGATENSSKPRSDQSKRLALQESSTNLKAPEHGPR